jgi:hypothetical protein
MRCTANYAGRSKLFIIVILRAEYSDIQHKKIAQNYKNIQRWAPTAMLYNIMYHMLVTVPEDQSPKSVKSRPQKGKCQKEKNKKKKKKRQTVVPSEHGSPSRFPLHNQSIDTSALGKLVKAG